MAELRPYQRAALAAWDVVGRRGLVSLPTGSGKTQVALAAIAALGTSTLCLVPTRVLLHQWERALRSQFSGEIGCLGDGERRLAPITVSTFESAFRHAARIGDAFDLLVVDEAHHFGGRLRDEALELCVAPFRLGLTATLPGPGEQMERLTELLGPVVYELVIGDLAGTYLASFDVVVLHVHLDAEERTLYEAEHRIFSEFFRAHRRHTPDGSWKDLMAAAACSDEGRRALAAWRKARRIIAYPRAKRRWVADLVRRHRGDRLLIFTPDNDTAYAVAREHYIMPITCEIGRRERDAALARFQTGELSALVSPRVLNEGFVVAGADVAVIVGGTFGEREHLQRVGRLLRPAPDKRALVYELVVSRTSDVRSGAKRRQSLAPYVIHPR
jgi:superfamily II DNA or RNA helicase